MADEPIEALMDILWEMTLEDVKANRSVQNKQWRCSPDGFHRILAAVRPGLDPFGPTGLHDQQMFGIPYIIDPRATDDAVLEDKPKSG